jgi:hypothetical protein
LDGDFSNFSIAIGGRILVMWMDVIEVGNEGEMEYRNIEGGRREKLSAEAPGRA